MAAIQPTPAQHTLSKHFDFAAAEARLYQDWQEAHCFAPNMSALEQCTIMMPPPNVTGTLHLGHALDNTLPDILIRRARMQGKAALYQPGTDHASIAVHVVLERQLAAQGQSRFDLGRTQFLAKAWDWKAHSHGIITNQMRRLGISCDWGNERFTMDEGYTQAVTTAFVELYQRGLVYRGQRLVNWDPRMQTAVSDLEVKHKEVQGHLWHFKYPYADGFTYSDVQTGIADGITIATTRPETILADGAIAINPDDPRAKDLVGKYVVVPIVERKIPIIADDYVDPAFGSGMVKITAAHDFNDFAVYQRHKDTWDIPLINLMHPDATMNENCPPAYQGLNRFQARERIIEDFKALGLFVKAVPHTHQVPVAERYDEILEPYITEQWYVKGKPLAQKVLQALAAGHVTCVHERDERVMRHWLENIEDWCISRQLWWGHRIPAWFRGEEIYVGTTAPTGDGWAQDEDIFDTWFSSALWPFATQGWPMQTERLAKFYPNTLINSGRDILFFWLVRMLMMGFELMDKAPFQTIYTHGLILDEHGQKMSKSKGNVVDPMTLLDTYGADAVRLTMASITSSEDMRFSEQKVEQSRNFCTKLWNAARFLEMKGVVIPATAAAPDAHHPVNQWIVGELQRLFAQIDEQLDRYQFNLYAAEVYHFTWGTWCDWYLELTKPLFDTDHAAETRAILGWGFGQLLTALHPVMPFITEEIWQALTGQSAQKLIHAPWPAQAAASQDVSQVSWLLELISQVRQARTLLRVPPKAELQLVCPNAALVQQAHIFAPQLALLAKVHLIVGDVPQNAAQIVVHGQGYGLSLGEVVDLAAEQARLAKEVGKLTAEAEKIASLLANQDFIARAPAEVVTQNQAKQAELQENIAKLQAALA